MALCVTRKPAHARAHLTSTRPHALRGVGGQVIWCEEADYMPPAIFVKIVLPLLEISNAVLLMITTVTNKYSLFHKVTEKRMPDTGEMIFNKIAIRLQCERCRRLRKSCRHNLHLLPGWKNVSKFQTNEVLYGEEFADIRQQESLGIVDEGEGGLIEPWQIDRLSKQSRFKYDIEMPPNYVHICVDPQAGGSSGYAISAVTLFQGRFIVSCALRAQHTPPGGSRRTSSRRGRNQRRLNRRISWRVRHRTRACRVPWRRRS